ncbi:RNA polymerase sigma factor SigM [Anaerohalosphaera lusitana]|uniref:RNA polymerase sigma factor SigM n=1 Tax=Anaerohalosphaera lusitana TaxID=1936003 RepID=A0A1U9NMU2_9BACT|nr:sigma-70 family RNA polymerase sigma factor [Anaerohalosphaera lusitana]AQT68826.1 RNA polymerase sigma factor SigM [Anaerohalosphaera lusitana]
MSQEYINDVNKQQMDRHDEFMRLYLPIQRTLYGYVTASLSGWDGVDDVVQDTLSHMWAHFDSFERGSNFAGWAITIARYRILEHVRKDKKEKNMFSEDALDSIAAASAECSSYEQCRRDALRGCLGKMGDDDRRLLRLRYSGSATIRGIADQLDRSVHTLYKTFRRLHIALFNCIERSLAQEDHK